MWTTIIMAAVAATAGLVDSIVGDVQAMDSLGDYEDFINQQYALNLDKVNTEYAAAKEAAEKSAAQANKQADITDVAQDVKETALSQDFNATIDNLYLNQKQNVLEWNAQAMNAGRSEGAALAGLAGSGIRAGSSLSEAIEMESAVNSQQLQFSQDATRKTQDNQLGMLLTNLAGNKVDIYGNRVGADVTRANALDLVNSYAEGGSNYNLYKNQLATLKNQYDYNMKQIDNERDKHSGWNAFWNGVSSFFTMGAAGAKTGMSLTKMGVEAAAYKTNVG
jgi:hypothetical protein